MKRKGRKKKRQKGRSRKVLLILFLAGIGCTLLLLFRQELFDTTKPWFEKRGILKERKGIVLYFSDRTGQYLIGEEREIQKRNDIEEEAEEIVNELIKGPKRNLIPTLPAKTRLLDVEVDQDRVAKVNFDGTLSKGHPGGSSAEMITLYSVVNSLTTNLPQIKRVQILIEGKTIETIAGHLSLGNPVSPKPDLIKKE